MEAQGFISRFEEGQLVKVKKNSHLRKLYAFNNNKTFVIVKTSDYDNGFQNVVVVDCNKIHKKNFNLPWRSSREFEEYSLKRLLLIEKGSFPKKKRKKVIHLTNRFRIDNQYDRHEVWED
jgi:hypothetical protein